MPTIAGEKTLNSLKNGIARYENYTHQEKLESLSKVYSSALKGACVLGLTALLSLPLLTAFIIRFGEAIIVDVINNVKPHSSLRLPAIPILVGRFYGALLGAGVSVVFFFISRASDEAASLSLRYRSKMMLKRKAIVAKLEQKLRAKVGAAQP